MNLRSRILMVLAILAFAALACRTIVSEPDSQSGQSATPTRRSSSTSSATPTRLPPRPVQPGEENPDEPVFITGEIPYTSPFFLNSISEPFVLLEDQAGFANRDREFKFSLPEQVIGPVEIHEDQSLTYSLALPSIPQGSQLDVDNDGEEDAGVQVFAVAYWSNTWGGPFLEERDGGGWSTAYASTVTDAENEDEIKGGILVIWSPDDQQEFPTGFGEDGKLFTEDDPVGGVPAGYSLVDLDAEPFRVFKEARPEITLHEGEVAVNDFSRMDYEEAYDALFEKASREYPFTEEKNIDWQALNEQYRPKVAAARNPEEFYRALRDFLYSIPDNHVGLSFNPDVFYAEFAGGFGMVLTELSDGRVLVKQVLPESPAQRAGIQPGAEILTWTGRPVGEAISQVRPDLGNPYSTDHTRRIAQVIFLTRMAPDTQVTFQYRNPGGEAQEATLTAVPEVDSLVAALSEVEFDELSLPLEASVQDDTGLGYIRVATFSDDYNLMARLWERAVQGLVENEVPGLIIDLRYNSGGSSGLAQDFAGYFFDEEIELYRSAYYSEELQKFEFDPYPRRIKPAPFQYEGPIAVLVGPDCVSACEGFAYALSQGDRAMVVGHYPTAGAYGEVGRGQYKLPDDINLQFPTGRSETMSGELLIEGVGVVPDVLVPVTEESALRGADTVMQAAIQALQEKIDSES